MPRARADRGRRPRAVHARRLVLEPPQQLAAPRPRSPASASASTASGSAGIAPGARSPSPRAGAPTPRARRPPPPRRPPTATSRPSTPGRARAAPAARRAARRTPAAPGRRAGLRGAAEPGSSEGERVEEPALDVRRPRQSRRDLQPAVQPRLGQPRGCPPTSRRARGRRGCTGAALVAAARGVVDGGLEQRARLREVAGPQALLGAQDPRPGPQRRLARCGPRASTALLHQLGPRASRRGPPGAPAPAATDTWRSPSPTALGDRDRLAQVGDAGGHVAAEHPAQPAEQVEHAAAQQRVVAGVLERAPQQRLAGLEVVVLELRALDSAPPRAPGPGGNSAMSRSASSSARLTSPAAARWPICAEACGARGVRVPGRREPDGVLRELRGQAERARAGRPPRRRLEQRGDLRVRARRARARGGSARTSASSARAARRACSDAARERRHPGVDDRADERMREPHLEVLADHEQLLRARPARAPVEVGAGQQLAQLAHRRARRAPRPCRAAARARPAARRAAGRSSPGASPGARAGARRRGVAGPDGARELERVQRVAARDLVDPLQRPAAGSSRRCRRRRRAAPPRPSGPISSVSTGPAAGRPPSPSGSSARAPGGPSRAGRAARRRAAAARSAARAPRRRRATAGRRSPRRAGRASPRARRSAASTARPRTSGSSSGSNAGASRRVGLEQVGQPGEARAAAPPPRGASTQHVGRPAGTASTACRHRVVLPMPGSPRSDERLGAVRDRVDERADPGLLGLASDDVDGVGRIEPAAHRPIMPCPKRRAVHAREVGTSL